METKEYVLALHGCDDSTYIKAELTDEQYELIKILEDKFFKRHEYPCMPHMEVKLLEDCEKYEIDRL